MLVEKADRIKDTIGFYNKDVPIKSAFAATFFYEIIMTVFSVLMSDVFMVDIIGFGKSVWDYAKVSYYKIVEVSDHISLWVVLTTLAISITLGRYIKAVIPINLILLNLAVHLCGIRAYMRAYKRNRRK